MNVLVVDDEKGMREMAAQSLRAGGYDVTVASSADEALENLKPDLEIVLTDLDMPGSMNGVGLTQRIRRTSTIDVLIMTGFPDLSTAIQAVREGAYDYLVKPFSPDTLRMAIDRCAHKRRLSKDLERERTLRAELDRAYGELSRMEKVRELFGQFTTPEVAKFVMENPTDFWKRGDRREVTVLFADVRDFTPYAGRVPPEEAVGTLNHFFEVLVGAVQDQGGVVNKFLGDGLMAIFGAPQPRPDHALAAARAAHKARAMLQFMTPTDPAQGSLRLGFSLNTGEVLAGCLGGRDRTEYSVIGSAVNLAARMEKAAGPGEIILGPDTADRVREAFDLESRGSTLFPGFEMAVELWALVGPKAGAYTMAR